MTNYFVEHYGEETQLNKLAEEAVELVTALYYSKHINLWWIYKVLFKELLRVLFNPDKINFKEEMGDVLNLIEQFEEHWNDGLIYNWKMFKRNRQIERIKNARKNI